VADLVASLTDGGSGPPTEEVLILSPYTGQVERLHKSISHFTRSSGLRGITVASVHRAQGSEASTVIFTIDDAPGAAPSQFMRARDGSAAGARLLNVALSRARDRAVIVLDMDFLKRCAGPVVQEFVYALEAEGTLIDAADIDGAWEERFGAPLAR
jgi:superfamily I DNA and/or RNA helicase